MYCSTCGTQIVDDTLRCPKCRRITPGLWLNLYSLSLLVLLALTNWAHLRYLMPIVANMVAGFGLALPPPVQFYIGLSNITHTWGWVVIPAILLYFLLSGRKVRVPNVLLSGKLLAGVAWVGLLFTLVGVFGAYIKVLLEMPSLIN